jgi:hypothetical protein
MIFALPNCGDNARNRARKCLRPSWKKLANSLRRLALQAETDVLIHVIAAHPVVFATSSK